MVAIKGSSSSFANRTIQDKRKNATGGSRPFKVHSEIGKESGMIEAKKSLLPKASRNTAVACDMKKKVGTVIDLEKTKSKDESSVTLRSSRKALADISNVKSNVGENKLRNTSKKVSSIGPGIKIGSCLSRKSSSSMINLLQGEARRGQAGTSNNNYCLKNADKKVLKPTSVVQRSKAQGGACVTTASRTSGKNPLHQTRSSLPMSRPVNASVTTATRTSGRNNTLHQTRSSLPISKPANAFVTTARRTSGRNPLQQTTRSSLPILKPVNKVMANKGSAESSEEGRSKYAFPVKPKVGRYAVPLATTHSFLGYRVSGGSSSMSSRGQAKAKAKAKAKGDAAGSSHRKSTKMDSASHDQQNIKFKDKKTSKLIVAKSQRKLKSSVSNKLIMGTDNASQISVSDHIIADVFAETKTTPGCKSSMLDSRTKSIRRKSFTCSLMEKPKLFGEMNKRSMFPNIYDDRNHLEVAEYVDDLYHYYWVMEAHVQPLQNYMQIQTQISAQMRSILVNWLIEVHLKFDLMQETLFLMVTLLDQYLSVAIIQKNELQLVALTALLLASKYEDFWHPRVMDLVGISAQSYTRQQVLVMERDFLKKLKFRLNMPTPYVFMLRFLKAAQADEKFEHLAFYLIELCLAQYEAVDYRPSLLSASAIYLARQTLQLIPAWTPLLVEHAHYQISEIRNCAEMMLKVHQAARSSQLKVTYDKYMRSHHSRVAAIQPLDALPIQ